jgi:peptidyl-prolyl cis-trans isomerase D
MLQAINDRIKGWLGAIVVALITVPFALWGIQAYLGHSGKEYAAKVNGDEITPREFDFNYKQQLGELTRRYGDKLPLSYDDIKSQVLEQMINSRLLEKETYSEGYRISDASLKNNMKQLFSRNGVFDRQLYDSVLVSRGMTSARFEYELRDELRVQQMQNGLAVSAIATDAEVRRLAELDLQTRDIRLLMYKAGDYSTDVTVSDDEITEYYRSHIDQYMTPEKVSVDYIELTSENLAKDMDVDEQQVKALYQDYKTELALHEERKARHILLKIGSTPETERDAVKAKMQQIQQELKQGKSFAELAKKYSQDPGSSKQGGDLGWITAGQMVKPFEDALFKLKPGEVSDIVETQYGLHLIQLEDVRSEKPLSYKDKHDELVKQLEHDAISSKFYDLSETMATTAYENPDSLGAVVDAMDLPVKTSKLFTRQSGEGIAQEQKIRTAAFSNAVIEQGLNSDTIELSPEHVVVLRMHEHVPASQRPLSEVRSSIEKQLRIEKGHKLALAAAMAARQKIIAGEKPENTLRDGQKLEQYKALTRTATDGIDPVVVASSFRMAHPHDGHPTVKAVSLFNGDIALVILDKVSTPATIPQDRLDIIKQQLNKELARADFEAALSNIKSASKIERNPQVLQ